MSAHPSPAVLHSVTVPTLDGVPGLVHGFERREGPAGPESREASRRRWRQALAAHGRLLLLKQVHGAAVHFAPWVGHPEGDAAVTGEPGWIVGIETADCLPVLVVDPRRRLAAAAHAGWRGAVAGVAARAVEALAARGSDPADLIAALGPAIGPCCYEVGDELRAAFGPRGDAFFTPGPRRRPHLDVRGAVALDLRQAGVGAGRIHQVAECTACHADRYPSFRRDGAGAGRMISYVGWGAGP